MLGGAATARGTFFLHARNRVARASSFLSEMKSSSQSGGADSRCAHAPGQAVETGTCVDVLMYDDEEKRRGVHFAMHVIIRPSLISLRAAQLHVFLSQGDVSRCSIADWESRVNMQWQAHHSRLIAGQKRAEWRSERSRQTVLGR